MNIQVLKDIEQIKSVFEAEGLLQTIAQGVVQNIGDNMYNGISKKNIRLNVFNETNAVEVEELRKNIAKLTHELKVEKKAVKSQLLREQKKLDSYLASHYLMFKDGYLYYKDGKKLPENIGFLDPIRYPEDSNNIYSVYPTVDSKGVIRMPSDGMQVMQQVKKVSQTPPPETIAPKETPTPTIQQAKSSGDKSTTTGNAVEESKPSTEKVTPVQNTSQQTKQVQGNPNIVPQFAVDFILQGKKLKRKTTTQDFNRIFNASN